MDKRLIFPRVLNSGISDEDTVKVAEAISAAFDGINPTAAMSYLLTGTLNYAAKRLPRHVLDGIYAYETDQVYGPRQRVRTVPPRGNHRRRRD